MTIFFLHEMQAALETGESVLTFAFAAVALELAFRSQQLQPFGFTQDRQNSRAKS